MDVCLFLVTDLDLIENDSDGEPYAAWHYAIGGVNELECPHAWVKGVSHEAVRQLVALVTQGKRKKLYAGQLYRGREDMPGIDVAGAGFLAAWPG